MGGDVELGLQPVEEKRNRGGGGGTERLLPLRGKILISRFGRMARETGLKPPGAVKERGIVV